eukprot:1160703-Pelagomonas_calceolata.AAC.9
MPHSKEHKGTATCRLKPCQGAKRHCTVLALNSTSSAADTGSSACHACPGRHCMGSPLSGTQAPSSCDDPTYKRKETHHHS